MPGSGGSSDRVKPIGRVTCLGCSACSGCSGRAGAGAGAAQRATVRVRVAADGLDEGDVELVGQRCDPGEDVAELMRVGSPVALADRLGQLAPLLRQPGDRRGATSGGVAVAIRLGDQLLEGVEVHSRRSVPAGADGKVAAQGLTYGAIPAMSAGGREGRPGWRLPCV